MAYAVTHEYISAHGTCGSPCSWLRHLNTSPPPPIGLLCCLLLGSWIASICTFFFFFALSHHSSIPYAFIYSFIHLSSLHKSTYCMPDMVWAQLQMHYFIYSLQQPYEKGLLLSCEQMRKLRLRNDCHLCKITQLVFISF